MPRDDMERQVVPRRGPARRHDAASRVGVHQVGRRIETHLGISGSEQIFVAPVRRGAAAIEQSRLSQ